LRHLVLLPSLRGKQLIVERTVMSVTIFLSQSRFDEPMDHENAIRLLRALVVRACKSDEPMADAFVRAIALEPLSMR